MSKCWDQDPKRRPGFSDLVSTLIALGAVESGDVDEAFTTNKRASTAGSAGSRFSSSELPNTKDRKLRGPSVHHISTVLVPKVLSAVKHPWAADDGTTVDPPESATILHAVLAVARPAGLKRKCPRDGAMGSAYVDTLKGVNHVGHSTALLSCEYPPPPPPTHTHTHTGAWSDFTI
jgi:hypothetical protein